MEFLEMFEKVNLIAPVEQRRFFNYYADSVDELLTQYDDFIFEKDAEYMPPTSLNGENVVLPLYHTAIIDNILFLLGKGDFYKSEFVRKSNNAHMKYWNDNAKGRRIRRMRW